MTLDFGPWTLDLSFVNSGLSYPPTGRKVEDCTPSRGAREQLMPHENSLDPLGLAPDQQTLLSNETAEKRLAVQTAVTKVLFDSATLNDAAPRILQLIRSEERSCRER